MDRLPDYAHSPRHPHSPTEITRIDNMAANTRDRPSPLTLRPLMVRIDPAPFVDTPVWSAPMSGYPHPQAMLPDSADQERVFEIDQQALQNLRSFQSQPWNYSPNDCFASTPSSSPSSAGYYERRHTLASPTTPFHPGFNTAVSPNFHPPFARRRSSPFASHCPPPERGMVIVVAVQLPRPYRPALIARDTEIWWPIQPCGYFQVHVGIRGNRVQSEKLTRFFPPSRLQQPAQSPWPTQAPFSSSVDVGQGLIPGAVLPIPGEPSNSVSNRRSSGGWSPASQPARRGSNFDFPGQLISKSMLLLRGDTSNLHRRGTSSSEALNPRRHHHPNQASHPP